MVRIDKTYEAVLEIKKSIFTATLTPFKDESLIKPYLTMLKSMYPKSHHIVYAYHLDEGHIQRKSDDGEPKDTAGKPVLGALLHHDLTDVLLTVRRDYGGILLGASGLIRAYSSAAHLVIEKATLLKEVKVYKLSAALTYKAYDLLTSLLKSWANEISPAFTDFIELTFEIPKENYSKFLEALKDIYPHPIDLKITEEKMTYTPIKR